MLYTLKSPMHLETIWVVVPFVMTSLLHSVKVHLHGKTLVCLVKAALGDNIMFMAFASL